MTTLYGIPNCDTMKKARKWLTDNGIEYRFHDYKRQGLDETLLRAWIADMGWEMLLNRRGTTWRKLPQEVRDSINEENAIRVMLENPSIMRRPVLETEKGRQVGFSEQTYQELFL